MVSRKWELTIQNKVDNWKHDDENHPGSLENPCGMSGPLNTNPAGDAGLTGGHRRHCPTPQSSLPVTAGGEDPEWTERRRIVKGPARIPWTPILDHPHLQQTELEVYRRGSMLRSVWHHRAWIKEGAAERTITGEPVIIIARPNDLLALVGRACACNPTVSGVRRPALERPAPGASI